MTGVSSAGARLRAAVQSEQPLQVAGAINAYCALLAERAGFRALYLSGAGVAVASHGIPDLGLTTPNDVLEDARRITAITDLPLLVDADTGGGDARRIAMTVRSMIHSGVAGMHIEDQVSAKRCGHRPGKVLVDSPAMGDRIKAAVDARSDDTFVVMARTDAYSVEGLDAAIDRALDYVEHGADMIFPEALTDLDEYLRFAEAVQVPVLANMTEFGDTPLFNLAELRRAGVSMVLYPLSAFRVMSAAAQRVYETLRRQGTQEELLPLMQTREQLYDVLNYDASESEQDQFLQNMRKVGK